MKITLKKEGRSAYAKEGSLFLKFCLTSDISADTSVCNIELEEQTLRIPRFRCKDILKLMLEICGMSIWTGFV
jgi:hypothetical protein